MLERCLLLVWLITFLAACGSQNNPSTHVPTLPFSFPEAISTEPRNLIGTGELPILQEIGQTGERIINQVNRITKDLNAYMPGQFSQVGSAWLSGEMGKLSNSAPYDYHALYCFNNMPLQHLRWSSDFTKIQAIRDLSITPFGRFRGSTLIARLIFEEQNQKNTIRYWLSGKAWTVPREISESDSTMDHVTAYYEIKDFGSDQLDIKAVEQWWSKANQPKNFSSPDTYLTARTSNSSSAIYVAHRIYDSELCASAFNEKSSSPNWCRGHELGTLDHLSQKKLLKIWDNDLKDIGIADALNLRKIEMETQGLGCPATK